MRVRATAHYGGTVGDVRGEMRRTYYVLADPALVKGFPIYLGDSGESARDYFRRLWHILRPAVLGREACDPRIWAT